MFVSVVFVLYFNSLLIHSVAKKMLCSQVEMRNKYNY